jgi:hypothetical protein
MRQLDGKDVMSKTSKDSARNTARKLYLEVVANADGTYEIIVDKKVVGTRIAEQWLNEELCGKYGFCGEEFDAIKRQLQQGGRANICV